MNKAQKRTWLCFGISLATLLIAAVVILFIWVNEIDVTDINRTAFRIYSLLLTIPLILIVIIGARFPKKNFDERDKLIDRKADAIGIVGAFIFLAGAGWLLCVISRMGSIRAVLILHLVYIACFVCILVSSVAALIQYGWGGKENE